MLNFRIGTLGPLWLEEFVFFAADEARRVPERLAGIANALAEKGLTAVRSMSARGRAEGPAMRADAPRPHTAVLEAELLDEPLAWSLATAPLVDMSNGTAAAIALHAAAAEQLDALTYGLDRLREELRPLMTYAPIGDDTVHLLEKPAPSIEQLLDLARENAKTRPKERLLTAA